MIQFTSKAAIASFFGVPEEELVEVKAGGMITYAALTPLPSMNKEGEKVGRPALQELDAEPRPTPNPLKIWSE